jgi:hypothetical protein
MDARYESVLTRFAAEIEAGTVVVHRAESEPVLASLPDQYFDWCTSTATISTSTSVKTSSGQCARPKSGVHHG